MKSRKAYPLKWQMIGIFMACWIVPVVLILGTFIWFVSTTQAELSVEKQTEKLAAEFSVSVQMCADRLDGAVEASRIASYDPTIINAWTEYQDDGIYLSLYGKARAFLDFQYRTDNRFRFAVLTFYEDPQSMYAYTHIEKSGVKIENVREYIGRDGGAILKLAGGLGTDIAFTGSGGEVYLVRNIVDKSFNPIAVLALSLHTPYFFETLKALNWAESLSVNLGGVVLQAKGEKIELPSGITLPKDASAAVNAGWERSFIQNVQTDRDYGMSSLAKIDFSSGGVAGRTYMFILTGMTFLLLPLIVLLLLFYRSRISRPIEQLMEGAGEIEKGEFGYRLDESGTSREMDILLDSFNQMSGKLRQQFNRLYQEELALRDARIKALQSHINPHFLNNTLEIINWKARMNGDVSASKMIEALTTVMDAVLDRDMRPEVSLREELGFVKAYLYIVGERYGKSLTITLDVDESLLNHIVPRLMLQPVIENAVEHCLSTGTRGTVAIRGYAEGETLILEVENDGKLTGTDTERIKRLLAPDFDASREPAASLGIANVNSRLRILHGHGSGLTIEESGHGTVIARLSVNS